MNNDVINMIHKAIEIEGLIYFTLNELNENNLEEYFNIGDRYYYKSEIFELLETYSVNNI